MKQKKEAGERKELAEGVSRKIKRDLEDIIDALDCDIRHKGEALKEEYRKMCAEAEAIAGAVNQCYSLWVSDSQPLLISSRNPLVLLKYARLFLEGLSTLRQDELRERRQRQRQNEIAVTSYNSNNVYELVARKNIEFVEMQALISDLKIEKELSERRADVAEEMTQAVRTHSDELLRAYRQNFAKITQLLRRAQEKETQILQQNRFLTEKIENLSHDYDNYKMNFKSKPPSGDGQKRLRERLEKQYQQRLKQQIRQHQIQMRIKYKDR